MDIINLKSEDLELNFKVTVSAAKIADNINKKLAEVATTAKIPGFRPGKIPAKIIEQKYKASVAQDVVNGYLQDGAKKVLADNRIQPATQPVIDNLEYEEGKDLSFVVKVEVMPVIKTPDFSKITLEKPMLKVDDKDIDSQIQKFAVSKAEFKKSKGKAELNDKVVIDFEGFVDGVAFPGGKAESHNLVLGSQSFIPGFEDQLVGCKAKDEVVVKVKFPEQYHSKDLAGKDSEFKVTVHEVLKPGEVKIDDEFAKALGASDLGDLKTKLTEVFQTRFEEPIYTMMKLKLFDQLETMLDFEVPKGMLASELKLLKDQLNGNEHHDHDHENCTNPDHHHEKDDSKIDPKEEESYVKLCVRRVRIGLFLAQYAEQMNIQVTGADVEKEITSLLKSYPGSENQIVNYYKNNKQALKSLSGPILEDKAVKAIFEDGINIKVKEYTSEKLSALIEKELEHHNLKA